MLDWERDVHNSQRRKNESRYEGDSRDLIGEQRVTDTCSLSRHMEVDDKREQTNRLILLNLTNAVANVSLDELGSFSVF